MQDIAERATRQAQAERDAIALEHAEAIARAKQLREAAFAKVRQERFVRQEQERAAAAMRAMEEADAKMAADREHRERIHYEIVDDLDQDGATPLCEMAPWDLIAAIEDGKIRHLKIEY
jgi:hypothetical protein